MATYIVAILCVCALAAGQILFKLSAAALNTHGSFFAPKVLVALVSAFAVYGIATIAWVWVLQRIELGRAYPLMALAFVLVPVGSYVFFGERFSPQYFAGVALIVLGIIVAVRA